MEGARGRCREEGAQGGGSAWVARGCRGGGRRGGWGHSGGCVDRQLMVESQHSSVPEQNINININRISSNAHVNPQ